MTASPPRRGVRLATAAVLASGLAGCLGFDGETPPPAEDTGAQVAPAAAQVAPAAAEAAPVERRASAPATATAVPRPTPPAKLLGLAATRLVDVFGMPTLKRRDPPAEVWQYAGRSCVLHLFLYTPPDGTGMAVAHVEASDPAGRPMASRACADRLAAETPPAARES